MKIKKFPPKSKVHIGLYSADVHFFSEDQGWTRKIVQEWIYLKLNKVVAIDDEDSFAETHHLTSLRYAVFFSKKASIQSLAHECLHVTALIMSDIGECCIKNQEPWCYLHGYLTEQAVASCGWTIEKSKS